MLDCVRRALDVLTPDRREALRLRFWGGLKHQEIAAVLADADVDAANLELVLDPKRLETHDFMSGKLAVIDPEKCTGCGVCADVCRFDAVFVEQVIRGAEG